MWQNPVVQGPKGVEPQLKDSNQSFQGRISLFCTGDHSSLSITSLTHWPSSLFIYLPGRLEEKSLVSLRLLVRLQLGANSVLKIFT